MSTELRYQQDHDEGARTQGVVTVTELIRGPTPVVRLRQTWFYPQGGGQLCDQGTIGSSRVLKVTYSRETLGTVDHQVDTLEGLEVGSEYQFQIDAELRRTHTTWHSAGHVLASVVETMREGLVAQPSQHWPGAAWVNFAGDLQLLSADAIPELNGELARLIAANLPVVIACEAAGNRTVQMGDFPPIACGGTHVRSLKAIGTIAVTGIKMKSGQLRVSYKVD